MAKPVKKGQEVNAGADCFEPLNVKWDKWMCRYFSGVVHPMVAE